MKCSLIAALLLLAAEPAWAHEAGRYVFGGAAEQGTFVLDSQTGRVWRYDRVDDAWYLYDLEALVRTPRAGSSAPTPRGEGDKEPTDVERGQEE